MKIKTIETKSFEDQKPGTSGLRRKTKIFKESYYLHNFIQAILDVIPEIKTVDLAAQTLVVGGDGRYFNREAIQVIVKMAVAKGFKRILVGQGGLFSTPAASAVIRRRNAVGGIILSASHNPGGLDEDFGIKYNTDNGGPANANVTSKIYQRTLSIKEISIAECDDINLDQIASQQIGSTQVDVINPLEDYTALMEELFDFNAISVLLKSGFRMIFDAMNAVTGPYAKHIFEERLGAPAGSVIRACPLEDFGGIHPDPNLIYAHELVETLNDEAGPDFGAASDGDGDRNMILGKYFFVSPGDSVAVIAEHIKDCAPGYSAGLKGVARSMPTSRALDRVAKDLEIPCYETPTGWKYFGNLMDAGKCDLCGEESFGTGSSYIREKDGLWAVLCWLSILAKTKLSVGEIMIEHWQKYGRSYFQRYDFEGLRKDSADQMMNDLRNRLPQMIGNNFGGSEISDADDFCYEDSVDGSIAEKQGIRLILRDGSRIVYRLSGTGTKGATLRLYLERFSHEDLELDPSDFLREFSAEAFKLIDLRSHCGKLEPDVVT